MSKRDNWIQKAVAGGAIGGVVKAFISWAIPIAGPVVTLWLGAYAPATFPWFIVWVSALVAFAATVGGMLLFDMWRQRRRVADKLRAEIVMPGVDVKVENGQAVVKSVQGKLSIVNRASFPLSYTADSIATRIVGHAHMYRVGSAFHNRGAVVDGETNTTFSDNPLDIPQGVADERFVAEVSFSLRYGHPGNEKYTIAKKANVEIINRGGQIQTHVFGSTAIDPGASS